ncbi:interference hedgehog-like [Macrosteles quadrilineatus]|uniref:interference hedgehog-like n=1 Tax=Macrosteles quadrilineatus TaxID=74068 RepID=UPI0023E29D50|nr:interference hedgehog-like [Macrosteles quadrilineatus]XP_054264854.1 interference hedgehog-like [Macrosteles quadrilineatus]XP_054264855.1 interference hedgehog-like [Macrosteles quadrilineatus]XP_054264856.1 interference hedgehog-like [Macrosteles quadrilineatus]
MYASRYTGVYIAVYMSQLAILVHADKSVGKGVGLWFVKSPEPIAVPPGDDVDFECSLNVGSENVRWKHNGKLLPEESAADPSSTRRTVKVIDDRQAGDYQCIAWYGASALASTIGRLTLAELKQFPPASPRYFTVTEGNSVVIDCPAPVSYPPAVIQYYFNNVLLSESSSLVTTNSLVLHNVTNAQSGRYSCSAFNYITSQTVHSPMVTTLSVIGTLQPSPPRFLYTPQATYVVQNGTNVTLECLGVGTPPPSVGWRRVGGSLPKDRTQLVTGGLRLANVQASDNGAYVCEVSNGINPPITHHITLQVQEPPVVTREPNNSVVEEGGQVEVGCEVRGTPPPSVTWLLNGESLDNDTHAVVRGHKLRITDVQKRHAGVLQCLAVNPLGSTYGAAMLQVSPKQVTANAPSYQESPEGVSLLPPLPPGRTHPKKDHTRKGKGRRKDKKHKGSVLMVPPTRPNITRLSDRSVMVRWSVPPNDGLPIQFFKVQYRELGGRGRGSRWMTSNEDIPSHIRSYEVDSLETDHTYRFRIAAVYSNNDNKLGPNSARFHLHRGSPKDRKPLSPPSLTHTEAISPSAIKIQWQYLNSVMAPVDGFYVYYRMTSNAGDYIKATVEGENTRAFIITHLLPDTAYDIKIQAFTVNGASDFSAILTHKTLKDLSANTTSTTTNTQVVENHPDDSSNNRLYVMLAAVLGGLTLLTVGLAALCFCKQRSSSLDDSGAGEECDKVGRGEPGLTIQQLDPLPMNGFAHGHTVTHNGKMNGYTPHTINITNNPLAEPHQDKNVMEMSYMKGQNNNCSAESSGGGEGDEQAWRERSSGENYV